LNKGFYFCFLLLIVSCVSEPESFVVFDSNQEFVIDLNQSLSPEGSHLVFEISSVDKFTCTGVTIENDLIVEESHLNLIIERFNIPSECDSSSQAIIVDIAKGRNSAFLESNDYDLTISANELFENNGTLEVSPAGYKLHMLSLDGLVLGKTQINKVPADHIWGSLNTDSSSLTYDEFQGGITQFVHKSQNLAIGEFGLFAIDSSEDISFPGYNGTEESKFIFEIHDLDGLRNHIITLRENFPTAELVMTLSSGEEI